MSSRKPSSMGRRLRAAALALAVLPAAGPAAAEPLDGFLNAFRSCDFSRRGADFAAFSSALADKFRNTSGFKGESNVDGTITVPRLAFVRDIKAVSHGDHTLVSVGLTGRFFGQPVSMIEFSFGNENGINAATLVFDAPRAAVVKQFGAGVARGELKGRQEEKKGEGPGYSAIIPPEDPGRISCDWST